MAAGVSRLRGSDLLIIERVPGKACPRIVLSRAQGEDHVATKSPMPTDIIVGQNIRICRLQQGFSQTELGRRIGVTFQQVQKYEKGTNRVGASRLTQIADVLGVPLLALFDGSAGAARQPEPDQTPRGLLANPHSLRLLQGFEKIVSGETRSALLQLVDMLATDGRNAKGVTRRE
jgi:transcriptional regulator with XRE-family HTH domain